MTKSNSRRRASKPWQLHEAKAQFSALVRQAKTGGPQHVTVHGREEVVVLSAADFQRLLGDRPGALLVELMRTSPLEDLAIEPKRARWPVRDVSL